MTLLDRGADETRQLETAASAPGSADAIAAYVAQVRERARSAVYPELFEEGLLPSSAILHRTDRSANGLRTVLLCHGSLDEAQRDALARFRLDQFLLCEWYDAGRIRACHAEGDPAFDALANESIHICVGNEDGTLLAYACLLPAMRRTTCGPSPLLGASARPLLPTEAELFGTLVFQTLPALALIPVSEAVEVACIIRNQVSRSLLSSAAVVELSLAITRALTAPEPRVQVALGQADAQARNLLWQLGYPLIYAPCVSVMPLRHEFYWHDDLNAQGRFWPFAVATEDLQASAHGHQRIERVMELPSREIRRELTRYLRDQTHHAPTALRRDLDLSPTFWTADAHFVPDASSRGAQTPHAPALAVAATRKMRDSR